MQHCFFSILASMYKQLLPTVPSTDSQLSRHIHAFFRKGIAQTVAINPDMSDSDSDQQEAEPFVKDVQTVVGDWNVNVTLMDQQEAQPFVRDVQTVVGDWNRNITLIDQELPEDTVSDDPDNFVPPKLLAQFEQSRAFLHDSAEYSWLLSQIKTLSKLESEAGTMMEIRRTILAAVDRHTSSASRVERSLHLLLPWEPFQFLKLQFTHATSLPPLESVIVISGSSAKPYATTCGEYVRLIWPAHGQEALNIAQQRADQSAVLEDPYHLDTSSTTFEISGDYLRSIEVAEVLVWLAVACRASESPSSIALCKPYLRQDRGSSLTFRLDYKMSHITAGSSSDCWHDMFRNPVIAFGYPVPTREHEKEVGLEVSTSMLSVLSRATWATVFGGVAVLKGWCTLATVAAKVKESVIWHFVANHTGGRIPYPQEPQTDQFSISDAFFPGVRHFVAWTESAKLLIGKSTSAKHRPLSI
jgi:hypothetical protein